MVKKKKKIDLVSQKKEQRVFKTLIRNTFKSMGFEYLNSCNKIINLGGQKGEFDSIFVYENIILLCEDTISSFENCKDHLKKKTQFFINIINKKEDFLDWSKRTFSEKFDSFKKYSNIRYKIFIIYFHTSPIEIETKELYSNIKFISETDLKYFNKLASALKYSARTEIYKFLGLKKSEIGKPSSDEEENTINTTIILPEEASGFPKGMKIVSFPICAKKLMDRSYVLRQESWGDTLQLYQRLIQPSRIKKIRQFIANNKRTFVNNIIVSLSNEVEFFQNGEKVNIDTIDTIKHLQMKIPNKFNSIGIIDGQHRVFAHYYGNDTSEEKIAPLREEMHLLATGIIFPKGYIERDRIKFESELFLQINSNQKKVNTALLQHIQSIQDPFSGIGIGQKVLNRLNEDGPFLGQFQKYSFESKKIKTPSIIRWGMKELVEISDKKSNTLFRYWNDKNKSKLLDPSNFDESDVEKVYSDYIKFCANKIIIFFNAVKENNKDMWTLDGKSKLLKSTAIVGFLISFGKSLEKYSGIQSYDFYKSKISKLKIDFSKDSFTYISSHWKDFADEILNTCFNE